MKRNEKITAIMTKDPIRVAVNQKVSEAAKVLAEGKFHHLPVVEGERLVGVLSYTDILRVSFADSFYTKTDEREVLSVLDHQWTLQDLMTKQPVTVKTDETVRDAAIKLRDGGFHGLPVVDGDGKLSGIVTSSDLINYLIDQY